MKTKKWMMLAAGVIMTTTPLFAQFNTVMPGRTTGVSESVSLKDDDMGNRQGKAFMEGCLSEEKSAPASSGEAGKEKWVKRYLSVCYPLRKMKVNSPYGYRTDPFTGKRKFHNGIDLHARGDKVLAMMEGTVIKVGQDRASGKYVVLRHGEFTVSYCHLSRILVGKGAVVRPRDAVGITGNTGRSTGEHLHITCRRNGKSVNPAKIFNYIKTTREKCLAALAEMS
ncbi:M23 family metallopeptidase [Odoribacter splanchnicus]|uniref:M23 family metallopeptidase n=1 Tax=Odoribacter splanchnicus TaxID=28118 RepID=UPI0034A47F82